MPTASEIYRAHPSDEEIADVLAGRVAAALGTLNEDGSIHLTYILFLYADGRFWLETASSTRKARNIAARGVASILVQGTARTGRQLMVEAEGTARLVPRPAADEANHRLRAKYLVADAVEEVDLAWGAFDDVAIELEPARWRSWVSSPLAEATTTATGRDYESIWKSD